MERKRAHPLTTWRLSLPPHLRSFWAAGALLGVSGTQMQRYERGQRRVPPEKAARYEKITGIPKERLRPDVFRPIRKPRKEATPALEAVG